MKLNIALKHKNLEDVEVGTCEMLQGSERRVIIISTVRSSVQYFDYDEKYDLGFVGNCKRFNVAITRAQSLMIVVGSPSVLCQSVYWKKFIEHCLRNDAITGSPLPDKLLETMDPDFDFIENPNDFTDEQFADLRKGDKTALQMYFNKLADKENSSLNRSDTFAEEKKSN